jgi:hypothetical protein
MEIGRMQDKKGGITEVRIITRGLRSKGYKRRAG